MLGASLQPQAILRVGKIGERHKVPDPLYMFAERRLEICDDGHLVLPRCDTSTAEFTDSILKPPVHGAPSSISQDGTAWNHSGIPWKLYFLRLDWRKLPNVSVLTSRAALALYPRRHRTVRSRLPDLGGRILTVLF